MKAMMQLLKQDKELKRTLYCLLICFFSIVAVTLAWFSNFKTASSEDIEAVSIYSVNLKVSLDGINFSDSVTIPIPDNLVFEPVSGSGKENTMYVPELPVGSNDAAQADEWRAVTYDSAAEQNSFLYFSLYFQADRPGYVILSDVAVEPAAGADRRQSATYTDLSGNDVTPSGTVERPIESSLLYTLLMGNTSFTRDYIAGAARVGIVNLTNTPESSTATSTSLKDALIIPNDTYKLSFAVTNGICSCTMDENAVSEAGGSYYDGNDIVAYSDSDLNTFTESQIRDGTIVNVLELVPEGENTYVGQIDVRVWIEGNDNEAHEILSDGRIHPSLTFSQLAITP